MGYWYFNRILEEKLPELEAQLEKDGFKLTYSNTKNGHRRYEGCPPELSRDECYLSVVYRPGDEYEFRLQITQRLDIPYLNHKDERVLKILKRYIAITQPTEIVDVACEPFDMKEFE